MDDNTNLIMQDIRERLIKLEVIVGVRINNNDESIKDIRNNLTWVWRTVATTMITAIGAIFVTLLTR